MTREHPFLRAVIRQSLPVNNCQQRNEIAVEKQGTSSLPDNSFDMVI
jgi:hypothetical protein